MSESDSGKRIPKEKKTQNKPVQAALRERVKELTCLYGIAQIAAQHENSLEDALRQIIEILPPAWQYPDIALARIVLDGQVYSTPGFHDALEKQAADIIINDKKNGVVEVAYNKTCPKVDEGPFLKEERNLIDTVARQIALIAEQKSADKNKERLQAQLRHADRLATVGQLAAGIAHEINEPLNSVLGFAQLIKKSPKLPPQALSDVAKIESSALYARDIIKKLLIFARQMPSVNIAVDLNHIVEEGLQLFKHRFASEGIELFTSLESVLPKVKGDPTQLRQVLVNLITNSVQAMPKGGRLSIQTTAAGAHVSLIVEDTGTGMSEEVKRKIFTPFFTTKGVGEGTGLGLPVIYGIVRAHGGSIYFDSQFGKGTRFEIKLPVSGSARRHSRSG